MFKSLSPSLLALVPILFEYLSGGAAFPSVSLCISLPASTPLRSRAPTGVLGPTYTRHLYLGPVMGLDAITLRETRSNKDRRHLPEERSVEHSVRA
jgi:hypothetical protein